MYLEGNNKCRSEAEAWRKSSSLLEVCLQRQMSSLLSLLELSFLLHEHGSVFLSNAVCANHISSCHRYLAVHCETEDNVFSLDLGQLDFGTTYLFVITNVSSLQPLPFPLPACLLSPC